MRKCIHGRSENQQCRACNEFNQVDHETQRRLERCQSEEVSIVHTNETGKWVFAVSMDDAYWLNAFNTLKLAEEFIKRHKLLYKGKMVNSYGSAITR